MFSEVFDLKPTSGSELVSTRNSRFSLIRYRRNRVTLSPEPPGIFRFRLAPAGTGARADGLPVDSPTCRLQECIGARGASPQSSILRCGVDTLGQAHSSVEYWNKTVFDAKTVSGKGWSRVLQKCELFEFKLTSGLCSLHEHNP
jgi:hypothetical protein